MLAAGHAPFAWGTTPQASVQNAVALEAVAEMALWTHRIDPEAPELEDYVLRKHYERKHGPAAYYGQTAGPKVLGAHMLEVCPTLATEPPSCEIHPLGIGGKEDPVRLVFTASPEPAVNVAMIDLGDRFRMLVNEVDVVEPQQPLPNLPVARALWSPWPDLKTAAAAWIYAGGPHHTVLSQAATSEQIEDFAEMAGVECLFIDGQTQLRDFKRQLSR